MKIATVCTGIGSPEQALKNLGISHEIVFGCEIDRFARETYLSNFTPAKMYEDMTKETWEGSDFYSDLFIGGIPCQAFSLAGKRLGELDPRGLLFFDFYRYVKNQQPKYFIIENVKGLLSDNGGATFQNWINLLGQSVNGDAFIFPHEDSLMYNLHWQVLNTKDYGLPQNRERVFLIGIRNDLPNDFIFPKNIPLELRLKDVLENEVEEKYYLSERTIESFQKESDKQIEKGNNFKFELRHPEEIEFAKTVTIKQGGRKCDEFIFVKSATKLGYEVATNGDSINLSQINSETRRGRVGKQVAQTLDTACNMAVVETYNYPKVQYNLSGEKWEKMHEQSRRCYHENGISPTVHTAGGGNQEIKIVAFERTEEAKELRSKFIKETGKDTGKFSERQLKLKEQDYSDTILANPNHQKEGLIAENYRIRKLTPLECFRLQGFPDDFVKPCSNSQLYKQAGNSISVPVIQSILKNLLKP